METGPARGDRRHHRQGHAGRPPEGRDAYAHLFYFLSGQGAVWMAGERSEARLGVVVQIDAGVEHAYENTGTEDLVLVSLNIPQ